jgi:hypothetical protein
MATISLYLDCNQSFVTSLPLYNSPFLEQPLSPSRHHPTSSSCSSHLSTPDHAEVKDIRRVSLYRSTANIIQLKQSPPRVFPSFWHFFTDAGPLLSKYQPRDEELRKVEDSFSSEEEESTSFSSVESSSFSTPSPSPVKRRPVIAQHGHGQNLGDSAWGYIRPRLLLYKRPLSPIKQSSSTKSCDGYYHSVPSSPLPVRLASPFKAAERRPLPIQDKDMDWTCSLEVAGIANSPSPICPSICFSPTRDEQRGRRTPSTPSMRRTISTGDTTINKDSLSVQVPPTRFCGVPLPFSRRSSSTSRISSSTQTSQPTTPIKVVHRSPSVSFADLVSVTSALLATPSPSSSLQM